MRCLRIPNAVISIQQTCRFNKRTDNFSQRAKPISVAIYLRISSFLIKLPLFCYPSLKILRAHFITSLP